MKSKVIAVVIGFIMLLTQFSCESEKTRERKAFFASTEQCISEMTQYSSYLISSSKTIEPIEITSAYADYVREQIDSLSVEYGKVALELSDRQETSRISADHYIQLKNHLREVKTNLERSYQLNLNHQNIAKIQKMLTEKGPHRYESVKYLLSMIDNLSEDELFNKDVNERLNNLKVRATANTRYVDWLEGDEIRTESNEIVKTYKDISQQDLNKIVEEPWSAIHRRAMKIHQQYPGWKKTECVGIAEKGIWVGMDVIQLKASWGNPNSIGKTSTAFGTTEQWVYGIGRYVYVQNLRVTGWQN